MKRNASVREKFNYGLMFHPHPQFSSFWVSIQISWWFALALAIIGLKRMNIYRSYAHVDRSLMLSRKMISSQEKFLLAKTVWCTIGFRLFAAFKDRNVLVKKQITVITFSTSLTTNFFTMLRYHYAIILKLETAQKNIGRAMCKNVLFMFTSKELKKRFSNSILLSWFLPFEWISSL